MLLGRAAELEAVRAAAAAPGLVWIGGAPGVGKSPLLAALVQVWNQQPPDGASVSAFQFRAGAPVYQRSRFLKWLLDSLLARDAVVDPEDQVSLDDRSRTLFFNPFVVLERAVRSAFQRLVFVLDGLEEAFEQDPLFTEEILARLRSPRVTVVAAGRSSDGLDEALARLGAVAPFPGGLPPMSDDDMRHLIRNAVMVGLRASGAPEPHGGLPESVVDAVVTKSGGRPLHATHLVEVLTNLDLPPLHPDALPSGLDTCRDWAWQRLAAEPTDITAPALVLLGILPSPLTVHELTAMLTRLGSPEVAVAVTPREVEGALARLRVWVSLDAARGTYSLRHDSLRHFLLERAELREVLASARAFILDASRWSRGDAAEGYFHRYGAELLLSAGLIGEALAVTTDFSRLIERMRQPLSEEEMFGGWKNDLDCVFHCALSAGRHLEKSASDWRSFAASCQSPPREGLLPRDDAPWEPWRFFFQAAMNLGDDSAVTRAAEAFEASGQRTWEWLRWVNRPKRPSSGRWVGSAREHAAVPAAVSLMGHAGPVGGGLWLADGRILSWSEDQTLRVWDGVSGALLGVLRGHAGAVKGASVLADGRVLSWSEDGSLRLWDLEGLAQVARLDGHTRGIEGVLVLPGGRLLSWSGDHTMRLWALDTGAELARLLGHQDVITGVAATPDGRILSWSLDNTVRIWDGLTGRQEVCLEGGAFNVGGALALTTGDVLFWSRDISPDRTMTLRHGTTGASLPGFEGSPLRSVEPVGEAPQATASHAGDDDWAGAWADVRSTGMTFARRAFETFVGQVLTLPDGRLLSWGDALGLWDAATGELIGLLRGPDAEQVPAAGVLVLDANRLVSWTLGRLHLWDLGSRSLIATLSQHACPVDGALALAGGRILSWSRDLLCVWRATDGGLVSSFPGHVQTVVWGDPTDQDRIGTFRVSTRGATAHPDGRFLTWGQDEVLRVWSDVRLDAAFHSGCEPAPEGNSSAPVPRGRFILMLPPGRALIHGHRGTLDLWDATTGRHLETCAGAEVALREVSVLDEGRILTCSNDGSLCVWDVTGERPRVILRRDEVGGHRGLPGQRLATWSRDGAVAISDTATGEQVTALEGHAAAPRDVEALPDGRILSWSDDRLQLWDGATGAPLATLEGHTKRLSGARVLQDGRILSWSDDRTLRLWDGPTGRPLATLAGHTASISRVDILSDGRILSEDRHALRLWDGTTGAPLATPANFRRPAETASAPADSPTAAWRPFLRNALDIGHLVAVRGDLGVFTIPDGYFESVALTRLIPAVSTR
jgi:WD40 repeat protein